MSDDEMAQAITENYPQFAGGQDSASKLAAAPAPRVLAGLPVADPNAQAPDPATVDAAPPADPNAAAPMQNQFAASRMSRAEYEKEFRTLNPRAQQGAVDAALAQYDQQKAAQLKAADARRQAGPMKPIQTPEQFFDQRLNARLEGKQNGVVPQLPGRAEPENLDFSTQHPAGQPVQPDPQDVGDESKLSAAASYLGRSTSSGLYNLAGAGAKLLDAINPFTTSDADAAVLFKNDPAKLKELQDHSIALGLGRFARAMQANSSEQMDKISPRAKQDYGLLQYATTDPNKTAFSSPVKIIGDAVRSLPSSLAMGAAAYLTRGASLRAEEAALAAGFSAQAAKAAGVQAAGKMMGSVSAGSEGAIGYAQQALQTEEETGKLPMAKLQKSPKFQQLLAQGYTPETARAKIIADTAEHAGQIAGLVDAVTNKFGGEVLGRIIGEGGPFMRRVLSGGADEAATEFVQSAGEQLGGNFATQQNVDPKQDTWDGVGEAAVAGLAVGGLMGGVTAGVAGHHGGQADEHELDQFVASNREDAAAANTARDTALSKWQNSGLSPNSRDAGNGRREPTWAEAAGTGPAVPAAPGGRREPSIGDITGASSVDEAIAAASAAVNSTTPHATAADIDALEEQAGLLSAAGKPPAQTAPADLPPGGKPAPVANVTGKPAAETANLTNPASSTDTAADWHAFPAEMRTLGLPRAQMPQIRAEHRGAMVNFLNARGISHEQVEVAADTLHPTQQEFSVSKVDKALEYQGGNRSILISSDNYVLDGHHQWMAAAVKGEPVQAIRLNAPIKQLVKTVHEFPSSTVDTSSAPAAPASAAAPMPSPKPTAGQRMRERVRRENPFLAFLATHGLHIDERSDTGGQKGRAGNVIVPGFGGSLYRRTGKRLDELAQLAHEAGFLSNDDINDPADTGGTRKLAEMIERVVHSREVIEQPGLIEAHAPSNDQQLIEEAQRLGIEHTSMDADQLYDAVRTALAHEEGRRETSGAAHADEQDVIDHYESQVTPQELADADIPFDLNDHRLSPTNYLTDEQIDALFGLQKAASPRADRSETEGDAAEHPREGAAPAGEPGAAGQDLLTSYTAGDVLEREDAAAARAKAVQAERDRLDAQRKREQDAKEAKVRADATVDDFQLGQDPLDQLNRQNGLFDAPPADPRAQDRHGLTENDRHLKQLDSAVEEFTVQTKEELADITPAEVRAGALQWAKDAGLNEGEFLRTLYRKWTRNKNNLELQELAGALLEGEAPEGETQQGPATPTHEYNPERARPLLLIPCAEGKLEGTHKAVDLYKGAMVEIYRKWKPTENRPDVYILSAKHGIVHGDTLLENYEQPMTKERLAELMAKPVDLSLFKGKNFNEVYIAGSAQYRQLGQQYVEELRKAGFVGPDAPVDHAPVGAGVGTQRGHFADYLRKVDMRGPENAAELSDQLDAENAKRERVAGERERLGNATAPEHVTEGVDDRELGQIVDEFKEAQAEMMQGEHAISNVFQPPAKGEVVRLEDKTRVYTKEHGWMSVAEAKARIAEWKAHAQEQGEGGKARSENSQRVVLSLFDLTGKWSKPWEEAGYQVYRFDIQDDPQVGDVNNFSTEFFGDWFGDFEGMDVYAILAATPCTDFASSGSRHFAAKDADGRTVASVKLVHQTLRTIEHFKPAVWAIENPVGRIEKLGGLPPWRLSFNPNHLGDPYTKRTLLWGRFNGDLPIAPVEPTEGSKMHKLYGGKSMATKNARSATPEGFSYGFFMANNAFDNPVLAIAGKYDRLDRSLIEKAVAAGVSEDEISSAVDDHYYMDMDDDAGNDAIRDLIAEKGGASAMADVDGQIPLDFYATVTVPYRALGATNAANIKADKALANTREEIQQLEDMLKCMGG